MRYRVLGPLELVIDGVGRDEPGHHHLGSGNQERLLAVLLARRDRVVSVDALIEALWDEQPPRTAIATLRTYVSRLRRTLGDALVSERDGYRLAVAPGDTDADRFEHLVRIATSNRPAAGLDALDQALALWRGEPYGGHSHVPAVLAECRRLGELRAAAEVRRLELLVESGDAATAAADAEARLATAPEDESTWVVLVDALVRLGRSADATRAANRARNALAEVGLSPGRALSEAEARALGATAARSDAAAAAPRRSLPRGRPRRRTSSFLGRDADIAAVAGLIDRQRLVTLVGSGGVGKTRLARELMMQLRAGSGADVASWFVELGHLDAGGDLAAALVGELGLVGRDLDVDDALARAGDLEGLLVLDNAEHLIDDVAAIVGRMLGGGHELRVVVTSREPLAIDGEHVHRVAPLDRSAVDGAAQRLFVDRAAATGVPLDVDHDAEHIDRIVDVLDGLPLAIEMAAAQLATCSVRELADRLVSGHAVELATDRRDVDARHRSLADVIEWSIGRLSTEESDVLRDLTVFAGAFTLDDVVAVLGRPAVPMVHRLAERSLLTAVRSTERVRFAHFQVVREHLATRGPVSESLRARHARWCVDVTERTDRRLRSSEEPAARVTITEHLAELRAAHRWASVHDRAAALALSAGLHRFAQSSLNDEVLGWAERLVDVGAGDGIDDLHHLAVVRASAASRHVNRGESARGADLARRAAASAPDDVAALPALEIVADAAMYDGRLDEAHVAYSELYERARRVDDEWYRLMAWSGMVLVAAYGGPEAVAGPDDPVGRSLDGSPPTARAFVEYARAERLLENDPHTALDRLHDVLVLVRSIPSPFSEGITLTSIAAARARSGDLHRSLADHRAAVEHWSSLADRSHQATALRNLVPVLADLGHDETAAELIGMLDASGIPTYGAEAERFAHASARVRASLGDERWHRLHERGARRDVLDGARWATAELDRLVTAR